MYWTEKFLYRSVGTVMALRMDIWETFCINFITKIKKEKFTGRKSFRQSKLVYVFTNISIMDTSKEIP